MSRIWTRTLVTLGAGLTLAPSVGVAGPSRVEGLAGDPTTARNGMFVIDDLNVFLNPALAAKWRGRIPLSLGIAQNAGGVTVDPFGGALIPIGDTFTLGVYLNREPGSFADQAALDGVLQNLMPGGNYLTPDGGSGDSAPALFLPVDIIAAFGNDSVRVGLGVYAAFAREQSVDDAYDSDEDLVSETIMTKAANYVTASLGLQILGETVAPDFWVRYGGSASWSDALVYVPDADPENTTDLTMGIQGVNSVSFGARVPIEAGDFKIVPGFGLGFGGGRPFYHDRLSDPDREDWVNQFNVVSGTFGVGIDYHPDDKFRVVGTISGEFDATTNAKQFSVPGKDDYDYTVTRITELRLPVASIGAEAELTKHLMVRGAIRAGMATATTTSSGAHENDNGVTNTHAGNDTAGGGRSFSAAGGLSFPFEKVVIDLTAGGMLVGQEETGSFFSHADVTFLLDD